MKKLFVVICIVALCAGCGGSSSVDKAIAQIEKALEKVEKNSGNMTESDWKSLEKEVEEPLKVIQNALESDKTGAIQKLKLITVTTKWATVLINAGISEIEKETGIARENFESELEKVNEELEKAAEEIKKLTDSIQ